MNITADHQKLTVHLDGRIDSVNAPAVEKEIMEALEQHKGKEVSFDAKDLAYISSAGLRVLMKVRKHTGKPVEITDVSRDVYDILETTGFTELLDVKRAYRQISVDGLEVIGTGFYGTVYRLDPETIVKVYRGKDAIPLIQHEKEMAQKAFLAGIPTAISYDIVQIGEDYGSIFELLNARTFHALAQEEVEPLTDIIARYVHLLKQVHQTEAEAGTFPSYREIYLDYLDVIRHNLSDEQYAGLKELFTEMPERNTIVHGDIQMKNVMQTQEEPMLIDIETIGLGHPVFELAGLCATYDLFNEDDPDNTQMFLQMPQEKVDTIWRLILDHYLEGMEETTKEQAIRQITLVGIIRFLYLLEAPGLRDGELAAIRVNRSGEHLDELLPLVNTIGW